MLKVTKKEVWNLFRKVIPVFLLMLVLFPIKTHAATVSGQWEYELYEDNVKITAYNGSETKVTIPEKLDGRKVVLIGNSVFSDHTELKEIVFPETLTGIGNSAFKNCVNLTSIELPVKLESLGYYAFYNCKALSKIVINSENMKSYNGSDTFYDAGKEVSGGVSVEFSGTVKNIPAYLFTCATEHYARVKSITIGSNVQTIGNYAFENCYDLKTVTFGNNSDLRGIGNSAFKNCVNLTSIELPVKLESLGYYAFYNCKALSKIVINSENMKSYNGSDTFYDAGKEVSGGVSVEFSGTVKNIPAYLFTCATEHYARVKNITIGSNVQTIGNYAFENCYDLKTVTFGNNSDLRGIGNSAFKNCVNLTSIELPVKLESLGYYAFYNCKALSKIVINSENMKSYNGSDTFYDAGKEVSGGVSVEFSGTVKNIPTYLFTCATEHYARVKNITIGSNVQTIGNYAFENCYDLKTVIFGNNSDLRKIGNYAFYNCVNLTNIELSEKLENISANAFTGCKELKKVVIPSRKCSIYSADNTLGNPEVTVLYGYAGSTTETYANKYGYKFVPYTNVATGDVVRISGKTRYETAYKTADELKAILGINKFETIIVATGKDFADALSGSYLASVKRAPILLTDGKNDNVAQLCNYIKTNVVKGGKVYILGGTGAVSSTVEKSIKAAGYTTDRISGKSRYETSLKILQKAGITGKEIIVAAGTSFADSLSASATGRPIMLVKPNASLSTDQKAVLKNMNGARIFIVGGTGAVSEKIKTELTAYGIVARVSGASRYETSIEVAETFFDDVDTVVVASGINFPDGLCAGPLAAALDVPLILARNSNNNVMMIAAYVKSEGIKSGYVLGGTGALSDKTVKDIFGL